ncbi:HET-domain-containing protein [Plenodomus tracheiphilus IPT5]|uniref:HET-domain-containing protein n=1 Tax=Plenodomus tracheiphilus IPT5 TaxID=1408161 RepID=A0A6A7B2Y2_9PLEO|nr:HET-domain-containing protein [Plenodomus tracheiphilus IPT5]
MEPLRTIYCPLAKEKKEIRLLHLAARDSQAPNKSSIPSIECTFSIVSLDDHPTYEALSYVWGTPQKTQTININDTPIPITDNLHNALTQLQLPSQPRTLWVDAVCINQTNTIERTHQVTQMQLLYSLATIVVIYLGPAWPGSSSALDFFETTGQNPDLHYSPVLHPHVTVGNDYATTHSPSLRNAIIRFFSLPWWTRTWTVQEFVLAQAIIFQLGPHTLSGQTLLQSFENVNIHDNDCCSAETCFMESSSEGGGVCVWDGFTRMDMLAFMRTSRHKYTFLQCLSSFRTRNAFDARDRVYGMLGLARPEWLQHIQPDYTRPVEDVYRAVVTAAVEISGRLEFLSHCHGKGTLHPLLPSFIPDWTSKIEDLAHATYLSRAFATPSFNASSGSKADFKFTSHTSASTKGLIADVISTLGPLPTNDNNTTPELVRSWEDLAQINHGVTKSPQPPPPSQHEPSLQQTLCGGMAGSWTGTNHFWHRATPTTDAPRYIKWRAWIAANQDPALFDAEVGDFDNAHNAVRNERRFVVTEKGRLGFVPLAAGLGDVVAVLAGAHVPYVLRSEGEGGGDGSCYSVVGDAYVHGIMDGEGFVGDGMDIGRLRLV